MTKMSMTMIPPHGFNPAGKIYAASILNGVPAFSRKRKYTTGKQKAGVHFEKAMSARFATEFEPFYYYNIWFKYSSESYRTEKFAEPDGLLFDIERGIITIVEIKLRHCTKAWWQLRQLYQPILQFLFPDWKIEVCEVFRYANPNEKIPEKMFFVKDITIPSESYKMHKGRI